MESSLYLFIYSIQKENKCNPAAQMLKILFTPPYHYIILCLQGSIQFTAYIHFCWFVQYSKQKLKNLECAPHKTVKTFAEIKRVNGSSLAISVHLQFRSYSAHLHSEPTKSLLLSLLLTFLHTAHDGVYDTHNYSLNS